MKPALRKAAAALLLLLPLAGCSRKAQVVIPPESVAPAPPMSAMVQLPALPSIPPPVLRPVVLATAEPDKQPEQPVHAKRSRHKQKTTEETATEQSPAPATATAATPAQPEQAVNAQPSDVSPIGQLSTTNDNATTTPDRPTIVQLITSTENGLNAITVKHSLSDEEQKTAVQIRTFLTKANDALKVDDLAGANILATKAKLLLDELNKQ